MVVPLLATRILRRALKLFPRKVGIVDGEKRFTYQVYGERVNRLSNALPSLGLERGDRVAFLCYNSHQLMEAYFGVVQIGAILLPLNIRLSPQEIAYILNDSGAKILFLEKDFIPLLQAIRNDLKTVERLVWLEGSGRPSEFMDYEELLAKASLEVAEEAPMDENDVAELFYTSGTTGTPKGVMLTHRSLYLHALNFVASLSYTDADIQLHTVPLFHVNGWGVPQALTWVGGTHVMIRKFDPKRVLELIEQERVTRIAMVPTMANAILNFPDLKGYDLSTLRSFIIGGAPTPPEMIRAVEETIGCRCLAGYGLTETTPVLTIALPKAHLAGEPDEVRWKRQAKTGIEVLGVDLRVVNENGEDVRPDGQEVGEIIVRSDVVMKGYWNLPEDTDQVIKDGWFHTGDMATIDEEGYVLIVDRKKDIIISGGENISSVELENALYAHSSVLESAVIAVPDERWGEVPKAFVVLKPGTKATEEELLQHLTGRVAKFKVPKSIEFRESLPKGGTGKILKNLLREPYWKGYEKWVH